MAQKKKGSVPENGVILDIEDARRIRREKRQAVAAEKKLRGQKKTKAKKKNSARRTIRNAKRRLFIAAVFISIAIMGGVSVFNLGTVLGEKNAVLAESQALIEEKERLEKELAQVGTEEYIEQQARGELGMIKRGEKLYILSDDYEREQPEGDEHDEGS